MPSGALEILADDGRALFEISFLGTGSISVRVCGLCRHADKILDDTMLIKPVVSNVVEIIRPDYVPF